VIRPPNYGHSVGNWYTFDGVTERLMGSSATVGVVGSLTSVNTPGWRTMTKQQRAAAAWNPFSYERKSHYMGVGDITAVNSSPFVPSTTWHRGAYNGWPRSGPNDVVVDLNGHWPYYATDAEAKALSRLQSKISNASVNLANALAERTQTAGMLSNRLSHLAYAAMLVKRGQFKQAADALKTHNPLSRNAKNTSQNLANYWLEYQYGWRPLLSDIYGSVEALKSAHEGLHPLEFSASATVRLYKPSIRLGTGSSPSAGRVWDWVAFAVASEERVRYVVQVVEPPQVLSAIASLGFTNPASVAWEILPYSFVIDWILPIGPWLEQMEYARGLTFHRGTKSKLQKMLGQSRGIFRITNPQPGISGSASKIAGTFNFYTKSRTPLGGFPYMDFPSLQPKLGVERALSAISLLTQIFTTGKTTRK